MKIRSVIVWMQDAATGRYRVAGSGALPRNVLEFDAVIGDAQAAAEQLLKSVGQHPENIGAGPDNPFREAGVAIGSLIAQANAALPQPTPGTRWHNGCVEFTTVKGELLVVPLERIAWIELGPER